MPNSSRKRTAEQNLKLPANHFRLMRDCVGLLREHGYLSDLSAHRISKRLDRDDEDRVRLKQALRRVK